MATKKEIEEELMKTKQRIAELEETLGSIPLKELHFRIKELEDKNLKLEKEKVSTPIYSGLVRDIQAPYVSYKIHKVESGKFPKIETTIKVSGAIEELKMVDIEVRLNELKEKMSEHLLTEPIEIPE